MPDDVRTIAFYLPQFHPIPENDRWWGEGFTEWTNVRRGVPMFPGHQQPHVPAELGYYDLRDPAVAIAQAALARRFGIHGFCYYLYWFNGHRLLEQPLEAMLARGTPDFPFCVCWANENWTRRWDGRDTDVLMAQHYGVDDAVRLFDAMLPLFRDPRYIRIDGRPLLIVYKTTVIPDVGAMAAAWRRRARQSGVADPYLVACETAPLDPPAQYGFDATVEFPPHRHQVVWLNARTPGLVPEYTGVLTSYRAQVVQSLRRDCTGDQRLRCVFPQWDNTARQREAGTVFLGSTPEIFGYWVEQMVRDTRERLRGDERLLFVNAWNEWAEGAHLEPDQRYGTQYLEALSAGLASGARLPLRQATRPAFATVQRGVVEAEGAGSIAVARFGKAQEGGGVSVVMPVYNHARFLQRTLASIAAQTLPPAELVAVDDGSSDESAAIVEAFAATAPFPVTLARQRNAGAHDAINHGIALARGDTIALINSDDAYAPTRLERLTAVLDERTGLAISAVEFIDDDDAPATGELVDELRSEIELAVRDGRLLHALVRRNIAISSGNLVFRRAILRETGGFASLAVCHDWDFVLAATYATRVVLVNEPLYRYRIHARNTFEAHKLVGYVEIERVLRGFFRRIAAHPWLDQAQRDELYRHAEYHGRASLWPPEAVPAQPARAR